jgi:TatD DNase family protein
VILTDTHCHLNLDKFDSDRQSVLERAAQAGVVRILIPGLTAESSLAGVKLAETHPMLYAAVGVHPTEAETWNKLTGKQIKALALDTSGPSGTSSTSKVVAIGEIGLDYYWDSAPHEKQRTALREQLVLAADAGLPVILHMREARDAPHGNCAGDMLKILEEWCTYLRSGLNPLVERPGVMHSFSGTLETAHAALSLGFFIGVTGPVTFENAARRQGIVAAIPLNRILIETDAPFLAPHPYRGKRNEPAYVRRIADKIALIHSCSLETIAALTSENADRLFGWKETA